MFGRQKTWSIGRFYFSYDIKNDIYNTARKTWKMVGRKKIWLIGRFYNVHDIKDNIYDINR